MLLEPRRNREDVRVEDDVGRLEAGLLDKKLVGALADLDLPLDRVRLPRLVERHDDNAGAVAADGAGLGEEVRLPFLEADRVDDALALHALQAGLEDGPPRAVDHHRHARDLRLGRDVVEERRHGLLGVEHAFVHVDVDHVGAATDLLGRDADGFGVVAALDEPREFGGARDVGPLAHHLEVAVGTDREDFETGELGVPDVAQGFSPAISLVYVGLTLLEAGLKPCATYPRNLGQCPRRDTIHRRRDGGDVLRRRAAAAAQDVGEAARREIAEEGGRFGRQLVVLAERVREPGVRIAADVTLRDARELGEIRAHVARAERAVDADAERPGVADRHVEGVDGLPRQGPAAAIGDGDGNHQRQPDAPFLEDVLDGDERRLGAEGVEDRLEQEDVRAAVEEPPHLDLVRRAHLVERGGAVGRVVDVGRDRQRAVGRAHGAGDEARPVRRFRVPLVGGRPRQLRTLEVDVVDRVLERVVGLRDRGPAEGVRLDDVGAGGEILVMDGADDVGPRKDEHVAVPAEVPRVIREALAAEIGFRQLVALNHRPHRAVEDEDAALEQGAERIEHVRFSFCVS